MVIKENMMMIRFLVGLLVATFTAVSVAGLVEVNTSQYIRESGSPYAQSLEVTLENDGEIRISNINLQDADVELAASTQIYLNGSSVLSPFQVPYGGYAVFPLSAGTHYLEVTLRGKPGGGLEVAFYENKPDVPIQGKGWELLDDGTVLHRKTGLIWHRNTATPGLEDRLLRSAYSSCDDLAYIKDLNSGKYGSDPVNGNAGYSDWRIPSASEMYLTIDPRVSTPPLTDKNGGINNGRLLEQDGYLKGGYNSGMQFNDPLLVSAEDFGNYWGMPTANRRYEVENWITSTYSSSYSDADGVFRRRILIGGTDFGKPVEYTAACIGSVWPVRGGTPE